MISVVITTYGNREWEELAWSRAYPSAANQQPHEIIVHHEPDLEIGPARNQAAARATGAWLLFLDADDELQPGYISAMEQHARKSTHILNLYQPSVQYVRKGVAAPPVLFPPKDLRTDNYLVIGTVIASNLFHQVGGFEDYPHGFEDWSLWAKCWKMRANVIPVPEAIYVAHINPRSKHRTLWRNRKEQVELHLRVQKELFPELA